MTHASSTDTRLQLNISKPVDDRLVAVLSCKDMPQSKAIPHLLLACTDPNDRVREQAGSTLTRIRPTWLRNWRVRRALLSLVLYNCDLPRVPYLIQLLDRERPGWRTSTLSRTIVSYLDENSEFRKRLTKYQELIKQRIFPSCLFPSHIELLSAIGSASACNLLLWNLRWRHSDVGLESARALVKIGSDEAVRGLIALIADPVPDDSGKGSAISETVVQALLEAPSLVPVGDIVGILQTTQYEWRKTLIAKQYAANLAGSLKMKEAVPSLIDCLKYFNTVQFNSGSDEWNARSSVAEAIGALRAKEAVSDLCRMQLRNHLWPGGHRWTPQVAVSTIRALGKCGSRDAIGLLTECLGHRYETVRSSALDALSQIDTDWQDANEAKVCVPLLAKCREDIIREAELDLTALGRSRQEELSVLGTVASYDAKNRTPIQDKKTILFISDMMRRLSTVPTRASAATNESAAGAPFEGHAQRSP